MEEQEGRDLYVDNELPRQGTAACRPGHRQRGSLAPLWATEKAASMPHRQRLSGSAANATAPGEKTTFLANQRVSAQEERQERNQSSVEERDREIEKERESQTESGSTNGISGCSASGDNKQARSLLVQACGRGKGQRVPGELDRCPWRQQLCLLPPFPHPSRTRCVWKPIQHTPCLEISGLNSAPKL